MHGGGDGGGTEGGGFIGGGDIARLRLGGGGGGEGGAGGHGSGYSVKLSGEGGGMTSQPRLRVGGVAATIIHTRAVQPQAHNGASVVAKGGGYKPFHDFILALLQNSYIT